MKFRYVLIALAGALLCSCRNVVTWDCDEDCNSDFESAGEPSFGYQNDNEIFEYGNVCFYIEDSIAVIAPSVSDLMSIKAINAGYYRGDVVIPKTVSLNGKSYPVRKIGNSAFGSAFDVSSIDIPEGVTEIEDGAIRGAGAVTIRIPSTLERLAAGSISSCSKLSSIVISPDNPLYSSVDGAAVIIDKKKGELLKAFNISAIPASVRTVAGGALGGVKTDTLFIPSSVESIGQKALAGSSIGCIVIDPANRVYDATPGLNCIVEKKTGRLVAGTEGMTEIPENVREICNDAFNGIKLGDSIILNERLKRIGDRAFYGNSFKSVRIPAGVREIGEKAFALEEFNEGRKLESVSVDSRNRKFKSPQGSNVLIRKSDGALLLGCSSSVIPDGVRSIGFGAFQNCAIKTVHLPEGLVSVGDSAFLDCGELSELYLPESLKELGNSAFQRCRMLREVSLPAGLQKLGNNAFCVTAIDSILLPKGLTVIGDGAFSLAQLRTVTIPDGVRKIGDHAFSDNPLVSAVLPQSLEYIGGSAFSHCRSLETAELPLSVRYIGSMAFSYTQIDHVEFGDRLELIGYSAFDACNNITYVRIPASVKKIGTSAFMGCQLDSVTVDSGNERYYSDGCNVIVDRSSGELVAGSASAFIPDGVRSIGRRAFHTIDIHGIQIPEGVTSIGEGAFWGCSNAGYLELPSTLKNIGNVAFCYCSSVTSVDLPAGLEEIPQSAFLGCTSLEQITIPEGVKSIGAYAFEGCTGLKSITIPASVTSIGSQAFSDCWQLKDIRNASSIRIEPVEMPRPTHNYNRSMAASALDALMGFGE